MTHADLPLFRTPIAKNTDPASSHIAAERMDDSGARMRNVVRVSRYVRTHPGSTAAELQALIGDLDVVEVQRRLSDMKNAGNAHHGPRLRYCRIAGQRVVTWWAGPDTSTTKPT